MSNQERIETFRSRKAQDLQRLDKETDSVVRRKAFHERYKASYTQNGKEQRSASDAEGSDRGEEQWQNSEGDRLGDFGVDEDAEFYDEDSIPLTKLLQKIRGI